MISFFVIRGHDHEKLINLSELEKIFYYQTMEYHSEMENARYKAMFGGK